MNKKDKMTKSELFKNAHKLAKEIRKDCSDYRTAFSCALCALYDGYEMEPVETIETLARKLAEAQKAREDTTKYEGNKLSPAYKAACKAVVDARTTYRAFECDRKTRRTAERDAFTAVFGAKDALEELLDTQTASAYV